MHKVFIIAGEASGDLHGANLVKALLELDSSLVIQAYGGPKMARAGAQIVRNYEDFSFMGFLEVATNIRKVLSNLSASKKAIKSFSPDAVIFIDFPSFNLRIAKFVKNEIPSSSLYYYISPKVWAWKSGRVHLLNKLMDQIFVIFPFEKDFYAQFGYDVTYVGNPLMDEIKRRPKVTKRADLTAILPGSRRQEVFKMLPIFVKIANAFPSQDFEVSVMPHLPMDFYRSVAGLTGKNIKYSDRSTYELLAEAGSAIVTSGTATLETALFNTPQVVAYKTSRLSYWIGRQVVKVKYISLVNLILDELVVKELIQDDLNIDNLREELNSIIERPGKMLASYEKLRAVLGGQGASKRVALEILRKL